MPAGWIPYTKDLPDKPEVILIAQEAGLCVYEVAGRLMAFWAWADEHFEAGRLPRKAVRSLSHLCPTFVPPLSHGDTGQVRDRCASLCDSLLAVGWLLEDGEYYIIPNFNTWITRTAKQRLKEARRKQDYRSRLTQNAGQKRDKPGTSAGQERDKSGTSAGPTTPHHTTQEIPIPLPLSLDSPSFREAWLSWLKYRSEIRKALKPTTMKAQLKQLAAMGEAKAIQSIEESIRNGWQGLFEPKGSGPGVGCDSRPRPEPGKYSGIGKTIFVDPPQQASGPVAAREVPGRGADPAGPAPGDPPSRSG